MRIILSGAAGTMGRVLADVIQSETDDQVVAGVDSFGAVDADFPVYRNGADVQESADVVIDFSHHSALPEVLALARRLKLPLVVATTGLGPAELETIREAAAEIAILQAGNMSLGVSVLASLVQQAAAALSGYDIEIVEQHHNKKVDAPSGTAQMLLAAAEAGLQGTRPHQYGRQGLAAKRQPGEIGIHSLRGGTIVGEHEVIFAGLDEVITLRHQAQSKKIFANGALRAARHLLGKPAGLYQISDLFGN